MSVVWYTYADGVRLGPMTWDEVRAAARDGSLKANHWVWTAGYGSEWRRASSLETLFPPPPPGASVPPPPGPGEREEAAAAAPPAADGAGAPPPGFAEPLRLRLRAERSPFRPPEGSLDGAAARPAHCLAALGTAWTNMRILLFAPFSLRRWLLFSVAAFLLMLGAQPEPFAAPTALGVATGLVRGPASGSSAAPADPASGSRLVAFARRWQGGSAAAVAADDPDAVWSELGAALRDDSAAVRDWARRAFARSWSIPVFAALVLLYAALRAWFLSRGWALLLNRVYRRDDPAFIAWADAVPPSRALFRAVFALRVPFVALYAVAVCRTIGFFASLPQGEPVPPRYALAAATVFSLLLLADAALTALLRDCVAPRVMLLREGVLGALAALRRDAGWWIARYFGVLALFSFLNGLVLSAVAGLVDAIVSALGLPVLATFALAALVMPLQLWRTLWSLDLLFRLRPGLRTALPPRRAEEILRRMQGRAGARR